MTQKCNCNKSLVDRLMEDLSPQDQLNVLGILLAVWRKRRTVSIPANSPEEALKYIMEHGEQLEDKMLLPGFLDITGGEEDEDESY